MIQLYTRTFSISSSLPLYVNPPYSTHTFFIQTARQFNECLDRMLHTPVTSFITSLATARPLWFIMLFGLWPLLFPLQVSSKYEEDKVLSFSLQRMFGLEEKKYIFIFFLLKRIQDPVATVLIISIALTLL